MKKKRAWGVLKGGNSQKTEVAWRITIIKRGMETKWERWQDRKIRSGEREYD